MPTLNIIVRPPGLVIHGLDSPWATSCQQSRLSGSTWAGPGRDPLAFGSGCPGRDLGHARRAGRGGPWFGELDPGCRHCSGGDNKSKVLPFAPDCLTEVKCVALTCSVWKYKRGSIPHSPLIVHDEHNWVWIFMRWDSIDTNSEVLSCVNHL